MKQWRHLADGATTDMEFVSGTGDDLLEHLTYMSEGPKKDAVLIWTVVNQYPEDLHEFLVAAAIKELKPAVSPALANEVYGKEFVPEIRYMKPMDYFDQINYIKDLKFTATPRMPGARCIIYKGPDETKIYSATGQIIEGFSTIIDAINEMGLYNIVFIGKMLLEDEDGTLITKPTASAYLANEKHYKLIYFIDDILTTKEFDRHICNRPYKDRREFLETNIIETENIKITPVIYKGANIKRIPNLLKQQRENDITALYIYVDEDNYSFGFSQSHLLVKDAMNADLMIVDYIEDEEKPGYLKGFIVDYKNTEILIKDGYTARERQFYWYYREHYLGWVMSVQYNKVTQEDGKYEVVSPVFVELNPIGSKIRYEY